MSLSTTETQERDITAKMINDGTTTTNTSITSSRTKFVLILVLFYHLVFVTSLSLSHLNCLFLVVSNITVSADLSIFCGIFCVHAAVLPVTIRLR